MQMIIININNELRNGNEKRITRECQKRVPLSPNLGKGELEVTVCQSCLKISEIRSGTVKENPYKRHNKIPLMATCNFENRPNSSFQEYQTATYCY